MFRGLGCSWWRRGHLLHSLASLLTRCPSDTLWMQVPRKLIGSDAFQETPIVEVTRQVGSQLVDFF